MLGISPPGVALPPPPGTLVDVTPGTTPTMALTETTVPPVDEPVYVPPVRKPKPYRN